MRNSLYQTVGRQRVLVVGAGGIGCELLKNLVLMGFKHIEVVDLDTIELSNLNRQFLFQRQHIGQSKAMVAAEAMHRLAPGLSINPHWANIKDTKKFPLSYFASFDIILNALDNVDARRYVNNVCLSVGVPLVESGTAGYLGQTTVVLPGGQSECFDCTPKEAAKTFPVCTIRTTPSAPIHCVVWAKEFLLNQLFAPPLPDTTTPDTQDEKILESLRLESEAFAAIRELAWNPTDDPHAYSKAVLEKVFIKDIDTLVAIKELWESKPAPKPLSSEAIQNIKSDINRDSLDDQVTWDVSQWIAVFSDACEALRQRAFSQDTREISQQYFDKDDDLVMDFVAAAANIRANIFGIPLTSLFALKCTFV